MTIYVTPDDTFTWGFRELPATRGERMYKDFYHMKTEAFSSQPLPNVFFNSRSHKEAWHYLAYGIESKEPYLLLSGEYGMGKTTLCLRLIQALKGRRLPFVFVSTPIDSYAALLRKIAFCLGISLEQEEESAVQSLICNYFENHEDAKGISIIVDDVQEMDILTLNKLRLFANFNIEGFFPIRLLFFSYLSFLDKLKSDIFQPLNQRIKRRYSLEPFNFQETREYIYFRLVRSGAHGVPLFTDDAIQGIFDHSKGIPRIINNICDGCLLLGASQGLTTIDKTIVTGAIGSIEGTHVRSAPPPVQLSAEAARQPAMAAPRPVKEDAAAPFTVERGPLPGGPQEEDAARVNVDYLTGGGIDIQPQKRAGPRKGSSLKIFVIIAAMMFICGIILAISFDFRTLIQPLTDFFARLLVH